MRLLLVIAAVVGARLVVAPHLALALIHPRADGSPDTGATTAVNVGTMAAAGIIAAMVLK